MNRAVPMKRANASANRPNSSGSYAKRTGERVGERGTSSRGVLRLTGPLRELLPPVLGEQMVEDVADSHRADQSPGGVDDGRGDQVVRGQVTGHVAQRGLRAQGFQPGVEGTGDERRRGLA